MRTGQGAPAIAPLSLSCPPNRHETNLDPLIQRGRDSSKHCQGVTFVTAHKQDHGEPNWAAFAATGTTLAIYMGMTRIDSLWKALLAALPAVTPAAVVQWAGTASERRWLGRLDRLATDPIKEGLGSPAVILIGNAIGEAVDWVTHNGTGAFAVDKHAAFNARQGITEAVQHAA